MQKKNIAVIYGGYSGEFEISVKSGNVVVKHLNRDQYNVFPVIISREGWYHITEDGQKSRVHMEDFTIAFQGGRIKPDVAFVAIHGTPGEDGKLQSYFDLIGIPYTSCDVLTSSLTFNKYACKKFVASCDVQTAKGLWFNRHKPFDANLVASKLKFPVFIKPNNGGSSVGMTKVHHPADLEKAVEKALHEDTELLVEEFIAGREVTCGVFRHKGEIVVLPIAEVRSKKDFFDYEAKYNPSLSDEIIPAPVSPEQATECRRISTLLYDELNCKGVVRFDYIFNENGFYFLEVNTVPGLTEQSIVPQMARAYGLELGEFFTMLVEGA